LLFFFVCLFAVLVIESMLIVCAALLASTQERIEQYFCRSLGLLWLSFSSSPDVTFSLIVAVHFIIIVVVLVGAVVL